MVTVQTAGLTGAEKRISRVADRVVDEVRAGRLRRTFGVLAAFAPLFFLSVGTLGSLASAARPRRLRDPT